MASVQMYKDLPRQEQRGLVAEEPSCNTRQDRCGQDRRQDTTWFMSDSLFPCSCMRPRLLMAGSLLNPLMLVIWLYDRLIDMRFLEQRESQTMHHFNDDE